VINNWTTQVSNEEAARRAGGRRRYNRDRKRTALFRQGAIVDFWFTHAEEGITMFDRGLQSLLAERFGVSRSTICRDYAAIFDGWRVTPCPTCSSPLSFGRVEELQREGKLRVASPGEGRSSGAESHGPEVPDIWLLLAEREMVSTFALSRSPTFKLSTTGPLGFVSTPSHLLPPGGAG